MVDRVEQVLGRTLHGKRVGVLELTLKPSSDDMRDALSIPLVSAPVERGTEALAFDPVGRVSMSHCFQDHTYAAQPEDVAEQADAIVVIAEWDDFSRAEPK